jgi:hypothetical protein
MKDGTAGDLRHPSQQENQDIFSRRLDITGSLVARAVVRMCMKIGRMFPFAVADPRIVKSDH